MFKASIAAALALTALTPFAASAGGLAPELTEAPVVVVAEDDDVTGFAPALGLAPLLIGAGAVGLVALAAGGNNNDGASGTSGTN
ncbi:MAG: hypothetical protein KKB02_19475 [Alphaproteobacteria bacterium]|nr:hypothetical protein [Alphaproteobacteria bacterium]